MCITFRGAFLTLMTLIAQASFGQDPSFKRLTINDGLSQNTAFCILQDKTGFIWIGTEDGLNKYDGYDFTIYKHENNDKKSLSNSQINALCEDRAENLWIGTSKGLNLLDRDTESFNTLSNDFITSLLYDSRGNLWMGTFDGLKRYDYQNKKIISYKPAGNNFNGGNKVQTIFEDKNSMLWISIGNDLKCFDPVVKRFLSLPEGIKNNITLRKSNVRTIKQDFYGNYWFGTESSGLYKFNPQNSTLINYRHNVNDSNSLPVNVVRVLFPAARDELWIGTRDGLSIMNLQTERFVNYRYNPYDPKTLSHNSIRDIVKDRAGNIWIGTYAGGLNILSSGSNNFSYIGEQAGRKPGLSHRVVSSILKAGKGAFWIGTEGGGLNYVDRKRGIYNSYVINSKQQNIVKSLAKDENHGLWIGNYDGLGYLNTSSGQFTNYEIAENDAKPENKQVYALAVDGDGLWLGTDGRGLKYRDKNGRITTYTNNPENKQSVSGNIIITLLKAPDGNLWIGTETGLSLFDKRKNTFKQFVNRPEDPYSLSHNTVLALFSDHKKRLWIGTEGGGLNLYDKGKFYAITNKSGLANSVIHGIREDRAGNLWLSTNKGLSRIRFNNLALPIKPEMVEVMNYTVADGLQSNQFASGAAETGDDGELLFGGINGVTTFFPEKIVRNSFKPKVVITDFLIKNNPVPINTKHSPLKKTIGETDQLTLTHDQAFITFKFAALNFVNPEKNQYAYKLDGFYDDDWHFVGNQRTATYTNLDAGKYTFMIKAANNDGIWNNEIRKLQITVLPPWWETWWAYLIYATVIGLLLYAFYYYSVKTAKLKNDLAFEHQSHEKDQELAQRKLSFFTNISHEIKTPLTLILAPIDKLLGLNEGNNKIQNQLMLMQRNGERLLRLINQLLDFRKFESGSMQLQSAEGNVVRFMKEILIAFEPYASHRRIRLKLIAEQQSIRAWFDRDKLEKVMYNLLSNSLKFTAEGGQVLVRVRTDEGKLLIQVEDDGIGISPQHIHKIFEQFNHFDDDNANTNGTGIGLAFSKGLIELHHGSITVQSTMAGPQQKGMTLFSILLPLGNAHLSPEEMISNYKNSENIAGYKEAEVPAASRQAIERRKQHVLNAIDKERLILLIVEDNPDVRQFIAGHFETEFEIHQAENGNKGLELATELIPDIIISDVMMPGMDGIALCSNIKSDTRTSHIPIILLTARTPLIYKIEGYETGADDYITKPFNLNMLEARVWNLLDSRLKLRERYRKEISLQPKNVAITSPDEKFLEKAMAYIEQNISEPSLSVEELGKEVGMSRVTLYRKIKALTDQTAIEFIRSIRLKRAAQLLEQNKLNVNEVAYMVGFQDIDYFRRCFKEQFGYTPKEYASQAIEKDK
ncbi:ligand-binding sensor domain-containing protein/signal transduction histidine kinase/AraC-like DNA-binding protein [Pedobacter africanus]|uniref:Ligand-binding sensor domain-containing protein/signal transduction histidine kinase/AraC-like DNA-binding protein n=1 Tax=Pedobacter africanus TaxID=151894 RepID=A0ACC6KVF2_9SPHI|nr:two-component regulator propeller domain-containing protein [Pedobacter africanus]MDR6783229.1 ligand-binding sensor domain-containing protein/signal transduction histidine kinase/AraC-like DNA-binding protein [Pedobacter africanus]